MALIYFLISILIVVFVFLAYAYFTGKIYVFRGIKYTYLSGRKGPSIYDLDLFPLRKVESGKHERWKKNFAHFRILLDGNVRNEFKRLYTNSYLVVKDNTIVFERYYRGSNQFVLTNSFSMAKSIVSLLVGIAIEEGKIDSVKDNVSKYLSGYDTGFRSKLTVEHLLNMAAGMEWNESGLNPFAHTAEAYFSLDLDGLVEKLNYIEEPGEKFRYQSGATQILAMIIAKVSEMSLSEYTSQKLWKKIGASKDAVWSLDKDKGTEKAYCCFYATTRDFARLGQLILNKGKWNNEQIVPKEYVEELFEPAQLYDFELKQENKRYKYQWWIEEYRGRKFIYMRGILGQFTIVLPEENMVIVRTGHKRKNESETGHPKDIYTYIDAALKVAKELETKD